jgi:hypothetical protein
MTPREDPSRRARCDGYYLGAPMKYFYLISAGVTVHTVPYGTDLFRAVSLAVNCQATISRSLRDKNLPTLSTK